MSSNPVIAVRDLEFRYTPDSSCFEQFSLDIPSGKIFGLFGPNGAGKTTLMYLMTGVLKQAHGSIKINGIDISEDAIAAKKSFGFVPQDIALYSELSPMENLEFFGALCGMHRSAILQRGRDILHVLGLDQVRHKPIHTFSGGMKRRVNLAAGVIHHPSLIFLDEPTVGVDVQSRMAMIDFLKSLHLEGASLVYTSHQLSEAEELCEEMALIDEGKLLLQGTMKSVLDSHPGKGLEQIFLDMTGRAYRN